MWFKDGVEVAAARYPGRRLIRPSPSSHLARRLLSTTEFTRLERAAVEELIAVRCADDGLWVIVSSIV